MYEGIFEVEGRIKEVGEIQGKQTSTGGTFSTQTFWVGVKYGRFEDEYCFTLENSKITEFGNCLFVNNLVNVKWYVKARHGKTSANAFISLVVTEMNRVDLIDRACHEQIQQAQQQTSIPQAIANQATTQREQQQTQQAQQQGSTDLPF